MLHPKSTFTRFYRVVQTGTHATPTPTVTITAPAADAVVSGLVTIAVSASTTLPVKHIYIYVDGEEIANGTGTEFAINTCEWPNGEHIIFAVVKADSGMETTPGNATFNRTYAVSSYVPVSFNNFVSRVQFSEPFFDPSVGQTQKVTAVFASGAAEWALNIRNAANIVVRAAAGSGATLEFDWDGKDNGGSDLPNGIYHYEITGLIPSSSSLSAPSGSTPPGDPPTLGAAASSSSASEGNATSGSDESFVEYWITYPPALPGMEQQEPEYRRRLVPSAVSMQLAEASEFDVPFPTFPQTTIAPTRPPIAPVKGAIGKIGIAYFSYGPAGRTFQWPRNGLVGPANTVTLNDSTVANPVSVNKFFTVKKLTENFARTMTKAGWSLQFKKDDADLLRTDLIRSDLNYGGNNLFNQVNLGLFVSHGFYGSSVDFTPAASQSYQTYFPMGGNNPPNTWLRMSEFRFGGNLRWMGVLACDGLRMFNAESMKDKGVLPIGDSFHLLLSGGTTIYLTELIGQTWAEKMLGSQTVPEETVLESWYAAGIESYNGASSIPHAVTFSSAGWDISITDRLSSYFEPDPSVDLIFYDERVVFTP